MSSMALVPSSDLLPALLKLIEILDEENSALSRHDLFSHAVFTDRKNHALRELMAAQRQQPIDAEVRPLLQRLSGALQENARLLKLHISAVGEISDIIVSGLRAADSDGTYSRTRRTGAP